ncbi:MAG: hypothetical protein FJW96_04595 [Actinobacteria bacterium]|nr:hypothetical protein [Actinomycetota bacterium]
MRPEERDAILKQGLTRAETPPERRRRELLEEDLRSSPVTGRPLELRLRNFVPSADGYLAALHGPLPYMARLREIEAATAAHERALAEAWSALAAECEDDAEFTRRWQETAERWPFDEVNDLIGRHNRWYPAESRLPMDPRTGDFALVNGRTYRRSALDAAWVVGRFPTSLAVARADVSGAVAPRSRSAVSG